MATYCERCGPGLFDEPLNAVSNIAFVVAAWAAWRAAKRARCLTPGVWLLVGLSLSVGFGSALWHTFATQWAMVLDVVPIMLFQFSFLWLYGRWVAGLRPLVVGFVLAVYAGVGFWLAGHDQWLNGVLAYVPTLGLAWVTGLHFSRSRRSRRLRLIASAAVFTVALVCRSLDLIVCRQLPIGTHFLWHVLNGVAVFQAMTALVLVWRNDARHPPRVGS